VCGKKFIKSKNILGIQKFFDEIEKKYLPIAKANIKKQQQEILKAKALAAKQHLKRSKSNVF